MRPGQNKRMRGRPNNNRRGPNPLTRSYESNGPDVKIRGNAHHVAEKYLQLARDAHTGGDPVAAENYLQHAEHYFRLIAAAQAAQALAQSGQQRTGGEGEIEDLEDDDDFGGPSDRFASPAERAGYQNQQNFVSGAAERGSQRPATLCREAAIRSRPPGPGRPGRISQSPGSAGSARQSLSGPRTPSGSPVRRTNGQLSGQQAKSRRPPAGVPPLSRFRASLLLAKALPRARDQQRFRRSSPGGAAWARRRRFAGAGNRTSRRPSTPPAAEMSINDGEFEESRFPGRGRRRRLRSPYGFKAGQGDADIQNPSPIDDETPVSE